MKNRGEVKAVRKNNEPNWQSEWLRELDEKELPLADYVRREPIPAFEKKHSKWQLIWQRLAELIRNKRVMAGAGAFAMLIVTVCAVLLLRPTPPTVPQHQSTVIALEINPSVLMSTDKNGLVATAVALNEDADAVLSFDGFDEQVIGKPLPEAVKAYTDMCARLGFIDYSGDAVRISGLDADISDIEAALSDYFKENGIFAVVDARQKGETEFSELYGISTATDGLYEAVGAMQSFYSDRCAEEKELDELLLDYRSNILSRVELYIKEEIEASSSTLGSALMEIIDRLFDELAGNTAELVERIEQFTDDLDAISAELEGLSQLPESREEYFEKIKAYRDYRASELKRQNEAIYGASRESIDDASYEDYIKGIISEYGSLSEYFEEKE